MRRSTRHGVNERVCQSPSVDFPAGNSGRCVWTFVRLAMWLCCAIWLGGAATADSMLRLQLQSQTPANQQRTQFHTVHQSVTWDAHKTAIVICDMWDQHWCRGATRRVAEMAPRMNETVRAAREQGVLIIHCPSSCMEAYRDTPPRRRAQQAPSVATRKPLQGWCHLDMTREGALPIDDSDGGCDCQPRCAEHSPWKTQIATIEIADEDAITDSAEAYYLMKQRGIENVLVMGVHTNMCVLGRPFSIRQLVDQGQQVALVRDLTDTMYNSRMPPFISHFGGTDRVVDHIERHWCPTITSDQLIGGVPFRFSQDRRPHLVVMIGEESNHTRWTLPTFVESWLERDFVVDYVFADQENPRMFPGIELVRTGDVLLLSVGRRALAREQLALIRQFVAAGKPLVALRTSSHAFDIRDALPEGADTWPEFDREVLGGNYHGQHQNPDVGTARTWVCTASDAARHPVLQGVIRDPYPIASALYKTGPLRPSTEVLIWGWVDEQQPREPVAWTNQTAAGGRVFYTSLGHPSDFQRPEFHQLLANAVRWAAGVKTSGDGMIGSGQRP